MVKQTVNKSSSDDHLYAPIYPDIEDWPVHKQLKNRASFIQQLEQHVFQKLSKLSTKERYDILAKTAFQERIRIKEEPWKVDPPNDAIFWSKVRKALLEIANDKDSERANLIINEQFKLIINRYSEEIVGTFKVKTVLFARKFLRFFFNKLLNSGIWFRKISSFGSKQYKIENRIKVVGEVDQIRNLMTKGTVVMVPTHFSNIDSLFVGYSMDAVLGLPSFSYGAGLNLYNSGFAAYYMNRLGAYRVDRRKKNPIYLETLKGTSKLSIEQGVNNLFFPGGTRSRSGALENRLKLGLLGSAVEAQKDLILKGSKEKIFIFPVVLGYPFVLEAKFMIDQHLSKKGKEQYIKSKDQSYSFRSIFKFIWNFLSKSSDLNLTIGKPLDVIGNFVDRDGNSLDVRGNVVNIKDYFTSNGQVVPDNQRDAEYTKILADTIVDRYKAENHILSSQLVAFAGFQILKAENPDLDLFGILRLPPEDYSFSTETMHRALDQLKPKLFQLERENKIRLSDEIKWKNQDLLKHGIQKMGSYHPKQPLMIDKNYQLIVSQDFKLLFYYHNRLTGYGLEDNLDLN